MASRFDNNNAGYGNGHDVTRVMTDAEKADQTHMEYSHHHDNDPAVHTPKSAEQNVLDYEHRDSAFERKVLRKIDWRLVPVLCESYSALAAHFVYLLPRHAV